jgi:hypothetical protein
VWPAAVGHGAINAFAGLASLLLKDPGVTLIGSISYGLISALGYVMLALFLFFYPGAFNGLAKEP